MTLSEAISVLESHEFAAAVNVASDFRTFAAAVEAHETFADARQPAHAARIAQRALELIRRRADVRYENPWDAALAAYILLLLHTDRGLARLISAAVIQLSHLWWASKLARHIVHGSRTESSDGIHQFGDAAETAARTLGSTELVVWLPVTVIAQGTISTNTIRSVSGTTSGSVAQDWHGHEVVHTFRARVQNERTAA